jgi:hypothetical protein
MKCRVDGGKKKGNGVMEQITWREAEAMHCG